MNWMLLMVLGTIAVGTLLGTMSRRKNRLVRDANGGPGAPNES